MDLLIKNMDMPKDCYDCPLIIENKEKNGFYDCILIGKACALSTIHKDCPLVSVPPHGDLIERSSVYKVLDDRIDLYKEAGDEYNACNIVCIEGDIVAIPTILEASI